MTFVQIVGVTIFAIGIIPMFHSIDPELHDFAHDEVYVDNSVIVLGYVIMRVALVAQWIRVAVQSPTYRRTALAYIASLVLAQAIWIFMIVAHQPLRWMLITGAIALATEMLGPWISERAGATPWHAHHIAERYALLTIVTFGETVVGTVMSLEALLGEQAVTLDLLVIAVAGIGLSFSIWWIYFMVPSGPVLEVERIRKGFPWAYSHLVIFGPIAAVGAGLHVAGYAVEDPEHVSISTAVTTIAVAVGLVTAP